jgi:hypothetical protein
VRERAAPIPARGMSGCIARTIRRCGQRGRRWAASGDHRGSIRSSVGTRAGERSPIPNAGAVSDRVAEARGRLPKNPPDPPLCKGGERAARYSLSPPSQGGSAGVLSVVCDASENRVSRQVRRAISDPPDHGRDDRRISERDCQFSESLLGCGASVSGGDEAVEDSVGVKEVRQNANLVHVVRHRAIEQGASLRAVQGGVEQTAARRT